MTQYDKTLTVPFVLTRELPSHILANVMGELQWTNLRVRGNGKIRPRDLLFQRRK